MPLFTELCLRHRISPLRLLAANPATRYGGTLFDSKYELYQLFRSSSWMVPTALVDCCPDIEEEVLASLLCENQVSFPVVCKPDVGFRSRGVRKHEKLSQLVTDLRCRRGRHLVQTFVPDPLEYSIYYHRLPAAASAEIVDLTQRVLPRVHGDGYHSVSQLIERTPDWDGITGDIQRSTAKDLLSMVPAKDQEVILNDSATLAQGAIFVDSRHLKTPELETAINAYSSISGFYVGKFDVKVPSVAHLCRGQDMKLLEVNGLTSELNHIYDSRTSYREARMAIAKQMRVIFHIAANNRHCEVVSFYKIASRMVQALRLL